MIRVGAAFFMLSSDAALAYSVMNQYVNQPGSPPVDLTYNKFNFKGLLGYQFGVLHGSRSDFKGFLTGWSVVVVISEHH